VTHHPDALWNGATTPHSINTKATIRIGALTKATAATATLAAALFAAGSGDFTDHGHLTPLGRLSVPAAHLLVPDAPPALATPVPGAPAAGPAAGAAALLGGHALTTASVAANPLWPIRPALLSAALASAATPPAPAAQPVPQAVPPVMIAPPSKGALALAAAMTVRGTPYVWGGTTTRGFDCSGLMLWSFKKAGFTLPRTSQAQSSVGQPVSRADLQPGDLVFFYSVVSHVAIYVGNGMVLHAPDSGQVVKISPLSRMPFHNARRIV